MMLSALTITGEHRTGLIRTTFMATPRRVHVLGAKALVSAVFSGVLTAMMTVGSIALVRAIATESQGAQLSLTLPSVWRTVGAITLYAVLGAVLAVGLGALLRHSAAVIAVLVLLPFVVEPLLGATPRVGGREHRTAVSVRERLHLHRGAVAANVLDVVGTRRGGAVLRRRRGRGVCCRGRRGVPPRPVAGPSVAWRGQVHAAQRFLLSLRGRASRRK